MASNSKLTKAEKAERKEMLAALPDGSTMAMSEMGITFLVVPAGTVDWVYTSVTSPDEIKARRKVGEFHALARWASGQNGFALPSSRMMTAEHLADFFC